MSTRVRFAPSPTGQIHIGNIRTALFNWLWARKTRGTFILRVEDTDKVRSTREFEDIIKRELEWLGLDYDEGIGVEGNFGPYRQSQRLPLYQEYIQYLLEEGYAYQCFCAPEEIEKMRQDALEQEQMPRYNQRCRYLTARERGEYLAQGRKPVVRFQLPDLEETLVVEDVVRGRVTFKSSVLDDFVIQKSDGMPTYNYAVVIDDALMEITHVIRGEDHLSNTPKQILLYRALGFEKPLFAHLGMILDGERRKLSKRSDDAHAFVSQYRAQGYLPQAMVNYLALLGWSPPEGKEILSREELIQTFSLDAVNKSPAIFDLEKLNWLNGVYIRQLDPEDLPPLITPYLEEAGFLQGDPGERERVAQLGSLFQNSLERLSLITEKSRFLFQRPSVCPSAVEEEKVQEALVAIKKTLLTIPQWEPTLIKEELSRTTKTLAVKGKSLYQPLRYVFTGEKSGPDLSWIIYLLGQKEAVQRLEQVL